MPNPTNIAKIPETQQANRSPLYTIKEFAAYTKVPFQEMRRHFHNTASPTYIHPPKPFITKSDAANYRYKLTELKQWWKKVQENNPIL
jgi:hypothetical protein